MIVVVSEGVHHADVSLFLMQNCCDWTRLATRSTVRTAHLSQPAASCAKHKVCGIELNTLQRCARAAASKVDLDEAEALESRRS